MRKENGMGLLKSFLRGLASEAGRAVADKLGEQFENAAGNSSAQSTAEPVNRTVQQPESSSSRSNVAEGTRDGNLSHNMEYFRKVLREQFPECTFEENVPAGRLGWAVATAYKTYGNVYPDRPYEFVMYRDNRLVATILLTDHNRESLAVCKNTIATSEAYQVPCINFLMQFPNEASYVRERIAKAIA